MSNLKKDVKSFMVGAALVPAAGLLAHAGMLLSSTDDYSLSNRFETAYSFNTPAEHKTYTAENTDHGETTSWETPYMAHPLATYPAMLALGLLAVRGRRWYENIKDQSR